MTAAAVPLPSLSRRDTVGILASTLAALGLSGCKGGDDGGPAKPGGAVDGTDGTDGSAGAGPPSPTLDVSRLGAAMGAILDNSPWADRYQDAVAGTAAQIQALRDAGLEASADAATYAVNGVVSNLAGALGIAFADVASGGGDGVYDWSAETGAMVEEMKGGLAGLRGELEGATAELRDFLGSDAVPADAELAAEVAALQTDLRELMFEGGLSGQAGMNAALESMHRARVTVGTEQSLAATGAQLDGLAAVLASDADVEDWRASRRVPEASNRQRLRDVPPPDTPLDPVCDVIGWVSFFLDWAKAFKAGTRSIPTDIDDVVAGLPRWLRDPWERFVDANSVSDQVFAQAREEMVKKVQGEATNAALSEEVCSVIGAVLVILLWFVEFILTMLAFAKAISWATAGLGAFPATSTIVFLFILLQLIILYFSLKMVCAVIKLQPAFNALLGDCSTDGGS